MPFFFLTDSASGSRFICANTTGGPQRDADRSSGVTPVLLASHWLTGASTLEPSWDPGHRWEPELEPGPWFEAWPWPLVGTPVTLGKTGMSTFPELGVNDVGKSMELAAATFCDLGLTSLGLTRALIASAHVLMA